MLPRLKDETYRADTIQVGPNLCGAVLFTKQLIGTSNCIVSTDIRMIRDQTDSMITTIVWTDVNKLLQESNLTVRLTRKAFITSHVYFDLLLLQSLCIKHNAPKDVIHSSVNSCLVSY